MTKQKILVVDDEESLCEILKFNLESAGYAVDTALSAEQAMEMHPEHYDLILLDVMMEGMSGFQMAKLLRESPPTNDIAIIFCTAKDTEDDTVSGFNLGGDDYITKPFSIREVLARVKSVMRRSAKDKSSAATEPAYETLKLDTKRKICMIDSEELILTKKEFEILMLFLSHKGTIFSRDEILKYIWKGEVVVLDRTIDVNITRLRKKIGRYGNHIITRNGYGYGFEE